MSNTTDLASLRARVQDAVDEQIDLGITQLAEVGDALAPLTGSVARLMQGGKGLRAGFLYWGYRAGGRPDSDALIRLAASVEFFQAAALLHDDVMDRSDTRRGMPSAHRAVQTVHEQAGWSGDAARFGEGAAVLAGDLCLTWCDQLYATCGLPAEELAAGRGLFDQMRTQLMGGQFLDLLEGARGWEGLDLEARIASARRVIRYKSAKYTIEHPLLIGALIGGVAPAAIAPLSEYGLALGEAFQLRDDLLGVFGDPEATGKPAGDDLREGKLTALIAYGLDAADESQGRAIRDALGNETLDGSGVFAAQQALTTSGAVDRVEELITAQVNRSREALDAAADSIEPDSRTALDDLIGLATARQA